MKFSPSWPQVVLLAVLLSAIIVAHAFAPPAAAAVTSVVSTIVGAIFVDLRKDKPDEAPAPKEDGQGGGP